MYKQIRANMTKTYIQYEVDSLHTSKHTHLKTVSTEMGTDSFKQNDFLRCFTLTCDIYCGERTNKCQDFKLIRGEASDFNKVVHQSKFIHSIFRKLYCEVVSLS